MGFPDECGSTKKHTFVEMECIGYLQYKGHFRVTFYQQILKFKTEEAAAIPFIKYVVNQRYRSLSYHRRL